MNMSEFLSELEDQSGANLEDRLHALIDRLGSEMSLDDSDVVDLRSQIDALKATNDRLEQIINDLRTQMAHSRPEPVSRKTSTGILEPTYTMQQFMLALATKRGRTYAWRTDYATATQNTPGCKIVGTEDIQKWQKEQVVPEWAYTQIELCHFDKRNGYGGPEWKPDEVQYLIDLYHIDPHDSNLSLAGKCTERFGREITEQAIKGAIYRLGKQKRLPQQRPPK